MEKNVGGVDRLVRLVAGPVLIVAAILALSGVSPLAAGLLGLVAGFLALVVGAVFLVTGATEYCPVNRRLRVNTYHRKPPREHRKKTLR